MSNEEGFYRESELRIAFGEVFRLHPEHKDTLVDLWDNIKALKIPNHLFERKCHGKCDTCPISMECAVLEESKQIVEKFHEISATDKYWSSLVNEAEKVVERHPDSKAAKEIVHSVLWDLSEYSRQHAIEE